MVFGCLYPDEKSTKSNTFGKLVLRPKRGQKFLFKIIFYNWIWNIFHPKQGTNISFSESLSSRIPELKQRKQDPSPLLSACLETLNKGREQRGSQTVLSSTTDRKR